MTTDPDLHLVEAIRASGHCPVDRLQQAVAEWRQHRSADPALTLASFVVQREILSPSQLMAIVQAERGTFLNCPACNASHLWFPGFPLPEACLGCGSGLGGEAAAAPPPTRQRSSKRVTTAPTLIARKRPGSRSSILKRSSHDDRPAPVSPGELLGPYRIVEEIGRGGMGFVLRAVADASGQEVALKVLESRASAEMIARFEREARIVQGLDHENIIGVRDWGSDRGLHYVAMEYVAGDNLGDITADAPLSMLRAVPLVGTLARAAHYAHEQGVIHRDLKPDNVLIGVDGVPRILDFGLARSLDDDDDNLTRTGQPMGTPYYMSPEQCRGEKRRIDQRSDVYSLGAILYELLTQRRPFTGRSRLDLYDKIQNREPTPPRQHVTTIPRPIEAVCLRALAKEPEDRYPTALALAEDIERALAGQPLDPLTRSRGRGKGLVVGGAVAAGLLVIGLVAALLAGRGDGEAAVDPVDDRPADGPASDLWQVSHAAFLQAARDGDLEAAGRHLTAMDAAGVPAAVRSTALTSVRESIVERIRETLVAGRYERAATAIAAARPLLGDDPELVDLDAWASGEARLSIETRPAGCFVRYVPAGADRIRDLGPTPLEARLPLGLCQVSIEAPGGRRHEFPLRVQRDGSGRPEPIELDLDLEAVGPDMVLVPGGPYLAGAPGDLRPVDVASFAIDRTEVTLGRFAAYLRSLPTDAHRMRVAPFFYLDGADSFEREYRSLVPPPEFHDLPVHGLRLDNARRFAAWAGKRIPTASEWEKAGRGIDGRSFPWGDDYRPGLAAIEGRWFVAVGGFPGGASPYGCLDMVGGVREWTETQQADGKYETRGTGIEDKVDQAGLFVARLLDAGTINTMTGFRCARSVGRLATEQDLLDALSGPDAGLRIEAARASAGRGLSPALEDALVERVVSDPDPFVRGVVARSLAGRLSSEHVGELLALATRVGPERMSAITAAGRLLPGGQVSRLLGLLEDPDGKVRNQIVTVLMERHEPSVVDPLRALVRDASKGSDTRTKAAAILCDLGDPDGKAHLLHNIETRTGKGRRASAYYLWMTGNVEGMLPLIEAEFDDEVGVTGDIRYYLGVMMRDRRAVPALREGLENGNPEVRAFCVKYLGRERDAESRPALERLVDGDPAAQVRAAAREALLRFE